MFAEVTPGHQSPSSAYPQQASAEQARLWFAAYTSPRHEKAVVRHLDVRGVESFLPMYTSLRRWKNGCRVPIERPLFPGYVFVRIEPRSSTRVLAVPGIVSILSSGRALAALPQHEVEALRAGLPQRVHEPHPYLAAGDKVAVISGPFMGISGVLLRRKSNLRVVLTLDLIMQSVAVEIGLDEIEPVRN